MIEGGVFEFHEAALGAVRAEEADEDVFAADAVGIDEGHGFGFEVADEFAIFVVAWEEDAFEHAAVREEGDGIFFILGVGRLGKEDAGSEQEDGEAQGQFVVIFSGL